MDVTSWPVLRLSLLTDCWTILIRLCSGPPASGPVVSFRWVSLLVGCCLFRVWGFPPPVNVVNRAYQMDRFRMPIWSFYYKTNLFRQNTYLQNKKHTLTCQVGLVVTDLITSPVVSWEGWETPPPSTEAQLSFFAQPPAW